MKYMNRICRHCFSHYGRECALFEHAIICFSCMLREPYNAVSYAHAIKFFKVDVRVKLKMEYEGTMLESHQYVRPQGHHIKLYRSSDLLEMA